MTVSSSSTCSSISPPPERRRRSGQHDDREDVSLAFFKQYTLEYLAGLLDDHWSPLILRAMEQSDALYHATLAMGSMHKTILEKQRLNIGLDDDKWAIKQYTRSLRMLSASSEEAKKAPLEVILTACLLYIGFEVSSISFPHLHSLSCSSCAEFTRKSRRRYAACLQRDRNHDATSQGR